MGTRNLTMVIHEKKPVIAQYGQWDGYPAGQGTTVLEFLKNYDIEKSDVKMNVESSVKKVRPFVVTAIVKDINMTDELIRSLMDLQEKLHLGIGRDRKKVAIGVHDFDAVKPPFTYKAVDPE